MAGLYAGRGHLQQAVEAYQQLVVEDPYREPAHRELMRSYYRLGDRAAAIRQYEAASAILDDELSLAPEAETTALHDQIVRGDWPPARPPESARDKT